MSIERTPLVIEAPVNLTSALFEKIANRIETIAPIETNKNDPIEVKQGHNGRGTLIKLNAKEQKATVCVNGVAVEVILYTKPN
jgi:hypothetical protein